MVTFFDDMTACNTHYPTNPHAFIESLVSSYKHIVNPVHSNSKPGCLEKRHASLAPKRNFISSCLTT